jgi:hypothetical protein
MATIAWFVCPYDPDPDPQMGRTDRRCALFRYITNIPNPAGDIWDEIEILGGRALVKVSVSAGILATVRADPDFRELPLTGPVPAPIITALTALGYSPTALAAIATMADLRTFITTGRHKSLAWVDRLVV